MKYESVAEVESRLVPGVRYNVVRMSFGRRNDLMRRIRELANRVEFLEAGESVSDRMDAALLRSEVDELYLIWGLQGVSGLEIDGHAASAETLIERGPEQLCREALDAVRAETGLSEIERKN
jgi:hypothetical protein